jgi:hypothetical protein
MHRIGRNPQLSHPAHHDNCAESALTGIRTRVKDTENGRKHLNRAPNRVARSSAIGGLDPDSTF